MRYEHFPLHTVILSNLVSLFIYGFGFFILSQITIIIAFMYLIFVLFMERRLIRHHCINCYYWSKYCGFGKGKISALLFKKGDNSLFCAKPMTWKDMLPELLISFLPVFAGIVLLIINFDVFLLISVIFVLILSTAGNGIIRSTMTCNYCKQQQLGCPADKLFNKKTH